MNEKTPPQNNSEHLRHLRENITVGRSAYRKDGSRVIGANGEPIYRGYESGWNELQVYTNDSGVEMSIVGKSDTDPETGVERFISKHVPTAELDDIQERLRNTQREKVSDTAGKAALKLVEIPKPEISEQAERLYRQRLEELSKPLKTNAAGEYVSLETSNDEDNSYDELFDEQAPIESRSIEAAAGSKKNTLDVVRPDDIKAANEVASLLLSGDLKQILIQARIDNPQSSLLDIARNDHATRTKLLDELMRRVGGYNIRSNEFKSINHGGYDVAKVTSQEAAALYALSMIDGSYDGEASRIDPIHVSGGRVKLGKHRHAALKALDLLDTTYAKRHVGIVND